MKIYDDLIEDHLRKRYLIKAFGRKCSDPLLLPLYYREGIVVEANQIYITDAAMLPPIKNIPPEVLLICVGQTPSLSYRCQGFRLLVIPDATLNDVFNEVLSVFRYFEDWEKGMTKLVDSSLDIPQMVKLSFPLFDNDLVVLDENLYIIAAIIYKTANDGCMYVEEVTPYVSSMPLEKVGDFLEDYPSNITRHGIYVGNGDCYCKNFYVDHHFAGLMAVYPRTAPFKPGDILLFEELGKYMDKAVQTLYEHKQIEKNALGMKLRQLLDGIQDVYNDEEDFTSLYLCACIQPNSQIQKFTPEYLCNTISNELHQSPIILYSNHLVAVIRLSPSRDGKKSAVNALEKVLKTLGISAGISDTFQSLGRLRYYYKQAYQALEFGSASRPEQTIHTFETYALRYLLYHSPGEFPARYICPQGLLKLRDHSRRGVDYWATLHCYLDVQMNITRASEQLHIHRNTLLQRIEKIRNVLALDLDDPDVRLWLQICIALFELESDDK